MKKLMPVLGKLLVLCIFALACWLLYNKLRSYSLEEIGTSILMIPNGQLLLSAGLVVLNYLILIGYDWLAIRAIHRKLPFPRVSLVSFTGCVVSYNFGALLGGTTVRYRLYRAWGFHPLDIVRLVLMLAVTFWIGALGLAGLVLLFDDFNIPPELGIEAAHIRPLGAMLVGVCVLYLVLCWLAKGRSIRFFKKEFALPSLPIALSQTLVACADLVVAALCMYVLLPEGSISFGAFLPDYLLAQVAVVLTHVPGGVGVLEVILMHLTHGVEPQRIFAAILMFRVLYYLLPLAITAITLLFYEMRLRQRTPEQIEAEAAATILPHNPPYRGF